MIPQYPYQEIKCLWCSKPIKILLQKDFMLLSQKVSILIKVSHQKTKITYFLSHYINFNFIEERCQYWFNKTDGRLTSPNFGDNELGYPQWYDYNINCTWILNADRGFYITLVFEYFEVNDNTNDIYFYNYVKSHSSYKI